MTKVTSNRPAKTQTGPVMAEYLDRLGKKEIEPDEAQYAAVLELDKLFFALPARRQTQNGSLFRLPWRAKDEDKREGPGLYLYGDVGRGKTMLMDMFFETVPVKDKSRWHFHEFMAHTHEKIALARAQVDGDPIPAVAASISSNTSLLCFDELHVTDIADAMILSRLFKGLFERGLTVVATSNTPPDELYKNGLNRQLFVPFIDLIHENMSIKEICANKDFRLDKLSGRPLYFSPADNRAREQMDAHWHRLTGDHPAGTLDLELKGRSVHVPLASMGVARFSFDDLCKRPLGSLDYLRIAHEFHTILIDDIPQMSPSNRNEARRFINLIDTIYDCRVSLIASADAEPHDLYKKGDNAGLFERTASRLSEMRSKAYLKSRT